MTVTSWMCDTPRQGIMTLPSNGIRVVNIGATLIVGTIHDNPVGMYTGIYNITFNYN
jgi:hypothetical protein